MFSGDKKNEVRKEMMILLTDVHMQVHACTHTHTHTHQNQDIPRESSLVFFHKELQKLIHIH